jgi:hypothetical protein
MKILVDKLPREPEECLFVDKREAFARDENYGMFSFFIYKCKINKKDCDVCECNNLKVFKI